MKKIWIAVVAWLTSAVAFSQSAYDVLSINQMNPVLGTARYSAMAGAFGALGGNPSVTKDNPAGIGIYKRFDLTFTPSLYLDNDRKLNFALSNFALVINFRNHSGRERGYITSSLGISYNRLRNYSRYTNVANLNNDNASISDEFVSTYAPDVIFNRAEETKLIEPGVTADENGEFPYESAFSRGYKMDKKVRYQEDGHAGQWDFSYGVNISNRVYVGASMGVANFEYETKDLYDETSLNGNGDCFYLDNYSRSEGVGINFSLGALAKVTDFFRLGFAIHTPTFYNVDEEYSIKMDYNDSDPDNSEIDYLFYNYDMQSPFKIQASAGFVIGKRALIGLQYDMENYKTIRISMDGMKLESEEDLIRSEFKNSHLLKIGAEVKVVKEFALRAGFAFQTTPINKMDDGVAAGTYIFRSLSLPQRSHYITAGLGYEGEHFYADAAYVFRNQQQVFYQMLPAVDSEWNLNIKNHNILLSVGWRF